MCSLQTRVIVSRFLNSKSKLTNVLNRLVKQNDEVKENKRTTYSMNANKANTNQLTYVFQYSLTVTIKETHVRRNFGKYAPLKECHKYGSRRP